MYIQVIYTDENSTNVYQIIPVENVAAFVLMPAGIVTCKNKQTNFHRVYMYRHLYVCVAIKISDVLYGSGAGWPQMAAEGIS